MSTDTDLLALERLRTRIREHPTYNVPILQISEVEEILDGVGVADSPSVAPALDPAGSGGVEK